MLVAAVDIPALGVRRGITRIASGHRWATEYPGAFSPEDEPGPIGGDRSALRVLTSAGAVALDTPPPPANGNAPEERGALTPAEERAVIEAMADEVARDRERIAHPSRRRQREERRAEFWRSTERLIGSLEPQPSAQERRAEERCDIDGLLSEADRELVEEACEGWGDEAPWLRR